MPNSMISSVLSGLAGGVLASIISVVYAHRIDRKREMQARRAASFSLIGALEAFVISCAEYIDVANEELDTVRRTLDARNLKARPPKFAIPTDLDFKPIDASIASRILILPFQIKRSNEIAYETFTHGDAVDATEVSIEQFGKQGLTAWDIAVNLRVAAGFSASQYHEDWGLLNTLRTAAKPNS